MAVCACGGRSVRIRRRFWQRAVYQSVYRCKACRQVTTNAKRSQTPSEFSACPQCGTTQLRVRRKVDRIDTLSTSLVSRLKGLLGAELHHCEFCRFQFYDFKKVESAKENESQLGGVSQDSRA